MRLLVGLICLFTIPFTMLSLWDWAAITEDPRADWRSKRLVSLADELALLDQFLALVTIRYADGLTVSVHVDAQAVHRWQLPPVVLPELRENAVKHNECLADNPLQIEVRLEGDRLTVSHDKRPRLIGVSSTGVGLENLAQRFRLTTGVAARWPTRAVGSS